MSRFVDKYPPPQKAPKPMEVIVISMGRTGTLSLCTALEILGYKTYHLATLFGVHGIPHIKMMAEGLQAKHFGKGPPLGRKEFDKFLGDYNALTDLPGYFLEEMIASYPEAKFILTTRDPETWLPSMQNTLRVGVENYDKPLNVLMAFFSTYHRAMKLVTRLMAHYVWNGKPLDDDEAAKAVFHRHNETAQKLVPPERLLVMKMEDGLGWEKVCDFLGKEVPDQPFPRTNTVKEFHTLVKKVRMINTAIFFAEALALTAPVIGVAAWYFRYRR